MEGETKAGRFDTGVDASVREGFDERVREAYPEAAANREADRARMAAELAWHAADSGRDRGHEAPVFHPGTIDSAIAQLYATVEVLGHHVSALEQKLDPVCRPEEADKVGGEPRAPGMSTVAEHILQASDRVSAFTGRLSELHGRIDL